MPKGCIQGPLLLGSPRLAWDMILANLFCHLSKLVLQAELLLTHSSVMGIKASEAFLVGEVRPESEPHVGPRGQDHLLARSLLCVCGLPAAEGCQLLVLSFNLLAERMGECFAGLGCLQARELSCRRSGLESCSAPQSSHLCLCFPSLFSARALQYLCGAGCPSSSF